MDISKNLTTIAENVPKVYNAGYIQGNNDGYWEGFDDGYNFGMEEVESKYNEGYIKGWDEGWNGGLEEGLRTGIDEGKTAEWNEFWDVFQQNGTRTDWRYAFGTGWNDKNFYPKHNFVVTEADRMFQFFGNDDVGDLDLAERLSEIGISMDFSRCTKFSYMFEFANISRIGVIDCAGAKSTISLDAFFYYATDLITIDELKLYDNVTYNYNNMFLQTVNLTNLKITGVINNSINFSACSKLTHDSLMSIIKALKDYSPEKDVRTCTLGTTNLAKLTDTEKAIATEKGWTLA